jgi:hypothetical protein
VDYAGLGFYMRIALLLLFIQVLNPILDVELCKHCSAAEPTVEGVSSREAKADAIRSLPFQRINKNTAELLHDVVDNPSFYRRMPTQEIECDPQMFTFLVRRPEVMVNIWDLMGITQVSTKRTSPFSFLADDGAGTTAKCELVYGDTNLHIYYGNGIYDGTMTPRKMRGRCVCILRSRNGDAPDRVPSVEGTMDVFLKLDNFGADLLTRTLGPFVGKTADYNFVETAKFMSQISQICANNPAAAQGLANQLNNIDDSVRQDFAAIAAKIAADNAQPVATRAKGKSYDELVTDAIDTFDVRRSKTTVAPPLELDPSVRTNFSDGIEIVDATGSEIVLVEPDTQRTRIIPTAILPRKTNVYMRR